MNVAIITLPLHVNYGGILQAYALQRALTLLGHNVITLDIPSKNKPELSMFRQFRAFAGTTLNVMLGKDKFSNIYWPFNKNKRNLQVVRMSMRPFINKIMNLSPALATGSELTKYCESNNIDAIVVGSDQVWRPRYNSNIDFAFLSFLPASSQIKRIAVSASFGTSDWEFSEVQTQSFANLAKRFKAISVRELSGVTLCKQYWGVEAIQTIDPTMLLTTKDYDMLIDLDKNNTVSVANKVFSYIIDESSTKDLIIQKVCNSFNCELFELNPNERPKPYSSERSALKSAPKPIAQWLRAIKESKFVTTDSFHCTVFSILYHKPFIILSNTSRGQARIETLLKLFGLENRLIDVDSDIFTDKILNIVESEICWERVDDIIESKRVELNHFINMALS